MPVEQPSDIYREQLTSLYHGLALWKPNPVEDIYNQVSIGDVGYISSEGVFIRMFNVTLPWDDQSNRRLAEPEFYEPLTLSSIVRDNFGQVDYSSRHVSRKENAGNIQAATPEQTEGVTYICRGPGALLSLPCGGYREDVIHKRMFRERIRDNVERWFNWSRNADLPVDRMDDLILVTGCTLVTSYASAVLDDHIADAQISLASRPLNNGGASFVWSNRCGTIEYHDSQLNPNISPAPRNRCVFIRGFRARRVLFWTKPFRAAAEPGLDDPNDLDDPDDNRMEVNQVPYVPKYPDPLSGVLDYIAEKCLEADTEGALAVAHDDDLQIIKSKDLGNLTADAVLKVLHENKIPVFIENGVATLQGNKDVYNGESYRTIPKEEPSSSNLRTQGMNAAQNASDPSPSGMGPSSGVQLASDAIHDFGFSHLQGLQHHLAHIQVNGAFQNPPLQGNPGSVYCGGPLASYDPNLNTGNATATASSCQGGSNVPTNMPYGGLPTALLNSPSGQTSNPGANFQVAGQPPTMTGLHDLHLPEVFARPNELHELLPVVLPRPNVLHELHLHEVLARPNEQGNPRPSWELASADLEYEGGDDLRVIIHFRRTPPS